MLQIAYKRLRLMLQGGYETGGGTLRTYLNANIWHDFSAEQTVRFANNPIVRETKGTSLEIGGGIVADLAKNLGPFATVDHPANLGGEKDARSGRQSWAECEVVIRCGQRITSAKLFRGPHLSFYLAQRGRKGQTKSTQSANLAQDF